MYTLHHLIRTLLSKRIFSHGFIQKAKLKLTKLKLMDTLIEVTDIEPCSIYQINAKNHIQIMNVYGFNGAIIFMSWNIKHSIQRGDAELNRMFNLLTNFYMKSSWIECSTFQRIKIIAPLNEWINIQYLFYITLIGRSLLFDRRINLVAIVYNQKCTRIQPNCTAI